MRKYLFPAVVSSGVDVLWRGNIVTFSKAAACVLAMGQAFEKCAHQKIDPVDFSDVSISIGKARQDADAIKGGTDASESTC